MTDRELLELAAKAAGKDMSGWRWFDHPAPGAFVWCYEGATTANKWNPLTDDGDALRLAVRLGIDEVFTVAIAGRGGYVAACDANLGLSWAEEKLLEDPYAATRRAIVRAAAEIGRNMK